MPQSLAKNSLHLVFSTKNRHPFINAEIQPELHAYIATVLKTLNSPALIINSMEDHIHILFLLHRTVTLSKAVEEIKKSSSKWIKTKSPDFSDFAWQAGYGAFSVSESNIDSVKSYIQNQQEHHRTKTFQEELRIILTKHKIEFDERYLWD
jgi:REP element-mobilizing transposase RayT